MKTAAIIAEYNPFHNGHRRQIEETRRLTGADYILVVMSGDFVQRGAPAFADKYLRTQMALLMGADVVIELPALYALSSAEYFAGGAVALLNQLNTVDILSFGSELGTLPLMTECARLLVDCQKGLTLCTNTFLKDGCSYPAARERAMRKLFFTGTDSEKEPLSALFSAPNNILGLEYCKALYASQSPILPFTLKREDAGYHSASLNENTSRYASASAIRRALSCHPDSVAGFMPEEAFRLLSENGLLAAPLTEDDFSMLLYYKLLMEKEQGFAGYLDCTPDLSDKICKNLAFFRSFTDFCSRLKSKDLTYSRISRMLMHILLNIKTPASFLPSLPRRSLPAPYARLLGFRKSAAPLLGKIKKNSNIPLIAKLARARYLLEDQAYGMLDLDIRCALLYSQIASGRFGKPAANEFQQSPVIID